MVFTKEKYFRAGRQGHRVEKVWKNAELPSYPVKVNHHFEEDQK